MQFVVTCLGSVLRWTCHRTLCAFLHKNPPGDQILLPQESVRLPPLEVLEHTRVEKNVFRWAVYVLWLANQPRSYHWYRKIEKERPHLVPSMFTLLFWCSVSWLRDPGECLGQVALEIPRRSHPSHFRRDEPIRQGS